MPKYEISEQIMNNILVFLDRVDYKGIKEIQAVNEVLQVLNNPIQESESDK